MDKETARIEFEKWARQQPYFGYDNTSGVMFDRDVDGYTDACVHAAWMGFVFAGTTMKGMSSIQEAIDDALTKAGGTVGVMDIGSSVSYEKRKF